MERNRKAFWQGVRDTLTVFIVIVLVIAAGAAGSLIIAYS